MCESLILGGNEDKVNRYYSWFRYVNIGISAGELSSIETAEEPSLLLKHIENALLTLYGTDPSAEKVIRDAIKEAQKGPDMLMRFKEKKSAKRTATIYLQLLDNGHYLPLLVVAKTDGTEVLRAYLPETRDLGNMGEIQLSSKKVAVKPRKNAFTKNLEPISFEIKL